jgi:predicted dehydrogenase
MSDKNTLSRKVKIGMIGAGNIANLHAKYYKEIPNVELASVADVIRDRALSFAKTWNIPPENVFTDYREMIDDVDLDAVIVATPHKYHAEPAIYALKCGVNVMVEKPMASNANEALEMYKAALASNKILMVGFQNRFDSQILAAKRIVKGGLLGEFYYGETTSGGRRRGVPTVPSFFMKEMAGGGVLLDIGCYAIDNAMNILGFPRIKRVSGHAFTAICKNKEAIVEGSWGAWDINKFEVEDFIVAKIVLENNGVIILREAWAMHNNELGRTFFLGTRGGLKLNPLEIYRDEYGYMTAATLNLPSKDPWKDKTGKFVEAVAKNLPLSIDPKEIVYEQYVIDAIYESINREGEDIKLMLPSEIEDILDE